MAEAAIPEHLAKLRGHRDAWAKNGAAFKAWLESTREVALEPDLPIIDAHHHVWDMRELGGFNLWSIFKQQYYMTDEFLDDLVGGGHNIVASVFMFTRAFFGKDDVVVFSR